MQSFSTRLHGLFDYLYGALLVALPWIFGYTEFGGPAVWVPTGLGVCVIAYSLMTDYEMGVVRRLDMRAHLWLDAMVGATLFLSTLFFGFYAYTFWVPYIIAGAAGIIAAVVTDRQAYRPRMQIRRV